MIPFRSSTPVATLQAVLFAALWLGLAGQALAVEAALSGSAEAIPVRVASVVERPSTRLVHFVGTLFGNEEVLVSSQIDGRVEEVTVDLGDEVSAGALLARVEDTAWQARLREAEAMVGKAEADEARARDLLASRIVSAVEYETMKTNAEVARARRDSLRITLAQARVAAPIRGAVARRHVSAGEYVRPGSPLYSLIEVDPLKLRGEVPERFAPELATGQAVQVRVDAFPGVVFPGRISRVSPASNPQNRSVGIEARVDNADRRLKPGFFGNAAVVTRSDDRALMVPQEAVVTFAGVSKVFRIVGEEAQAREVTLGSRGEAGLVEIIQGLERGDRVAVSGHARLEDGSTVQVVDGSAEAAQP